mmetsp:Transcript_22057/g.48176  ORF Transcript_22057/g.48176 Transcript_22057/m.48176 type:complete len:247 (+) Transcript_22057:1134-1874(+)
MRRGGLGACACCCGGRGTGPRPPASPAGSPALPAGAGPGGSTGSCSGSTLLPLGHTLAAAPGGCDLLPGACLRPHNGTCGPPARHTLQPAGTAHPGPPALWPSHRHHHGQRPGRHTTGAAAVTGSSRPPAVRVQPCRHVSACWPRPCRAAVLRSHPAHLPGAFGARQCSCLVPSRPGVSAVRGGLWRAVPAVPPGSGALQGGSGAAPGPAGSAAGGAAPAAAAAAGSSACRCCGAAADGHLQRCQQ